MDILFHKFDQYKLELESNPNAKYMEYLTDANRANPDLNAGETGTASAPRVPTIPGAPAIGSSAAPDPASVGSVATPSPVQAPGSGPVDPNAGFGGIGAL